jgi:hypothetical protein
LCTLSLDDAEEADKDASAAARIKGLLAAAASGRLAGPQAADAHAEAPAVYPDAATAGGSPAESHGDSVTAASHGLERVAATAVSLAFLCDFYQRCVAPLPGGEALTTKQVVERVIMPATASTKRSFASLVPGAVHRPTAFASHAFGNAFSLLVAALRAHFADAVATEVFVWVDVFAINQHDPGADLHGGRALKRTIELSAETLVVLDRTAFPLTRLWCLYEMGSTPPAKLLFLTHGFSEADVSAAFRSVDVEAAECDNRNGDKDLIRQKISEEHGSLAAFQQLLRLRLLLKPTSYEADCEALLKRSADDAWRFEELCTFISGAAGSGSRLACIAGGPGEGKSTLAAALCAPASPLLVHARHFCKASDVRRQDAGAIIRSLSYQLALHFPPVAATVLALSPSDVESLTDPAKAWELLLKRPLSTLLAAGTRAVLLFDALDEAGGDGTSAGTISNVLSLILDLGRLQQCASTKAHDGQHREGEGPPSGCLGALRRLLCDKSDQRESESESDQSTSIAAALRIIVTSRPEQQAIMAPLRGCWRGDALMQLLPAALRADDTPLSKLLLLLQGRLPAGAIAHSIDAAYQAFFQAASTNAAAFKPLLAIVLAARQPPSMAQLEELGVRGACASLPGWGFLFYEREHCVHLLHRSLAEWLTDVTRNSSFSVDAAAGHAVWAEHCSAQLRAWLEPVAVPSRTPAALPPAGSYPHAHALLHLDAAGRGNEAPPKTPAGMALKDAGLPGALSGEVKRRDSGPDVSNDTDIWMSGLDTVMGAPPGVVSCANWLSASWLTTLATVASTLALTAPPGASAAEAMEDSPAATAYDVALLMAMVPAPAPEMLDSMDSAVAAPAALTCAVFSSSVATALATAVSASGVVANEAAAAMPASIVARTSAAAVALPAMGELGSFSISPAAVASATAPVVLSELSVSASEPRKSDCAAASAKCCSVTLTSVAASVTETPPSALRAATCSRTAPAGSSTSASDVPFTAQSASITGSPASTPVASSTA